MAIAIAQVVHLLQTAAGGSISQAITVSQGSVLIALGCGLLGTTNTLTFGDNVGGGSWLNLVNLTPANAIRKGVYREGLNAGTYTVSGTFGSANWIDRTLTLIEVTGAQTSGSLDQTTGQHQGSATGIDSITSGNPASTTSANCLVVGLSVNYNDNKSALTGSGFTAATGSPFASDGNNVSVESKRVTSTGVYPALFTPSIDGSAWDTIVAIFREASTSTPIVPSQLTASAVFTPELALDPGGLSTGGLSPAGLGTVPGSMAPSGISSISDGIVPVVLGITSIPAASFGVLSPVLSPGRLFQPALGIDPGVLTPAAEANHGLGLVPGQVSGVENPRGSLGITDGGFVPVSIPTGDMALDPAALSPTSIPPGDLALVPGPLAGSPVSASAFGLLPGSMSPIPGAPPAFTIDPGTVTIAGLALESFGLIPGFLAPTPFSFPSFALDPVFLAPSVLSLPALAVDPGQASSSGIGNDGLGLVPGSMTPLAVFSPNLNGTVIPDVLTPQRLANPALGIVAGGMAPSSIPSAALGGNINLGSMVPVVLASPSLSIDPTGISTNGGAGAGMAVVGGGLSPLSLASTAESFVPVRLTVQPLDGASLAFFPGSFNPSLISGSGVALVGGGMVGGSFSPGVLAIDPSVLTGVPIPSPNVSGGSFPLVPDALVPVVLSAPSPGVVGGSFSPVLFSSADAVIDPGALVPGGFGSLSSVLVPYSGSVLALPMASLGVVPVQESPASVAGGSLPKPYIIPDGLVPSGLALSSAGIAPRLLVAVSLQDPTVPNIRVPGQANRERTFRKGRIEHLEYQLVTLAAADRAIRDWFDKTVDVHVEHPTTDRYKVPVIFSSGERFATSRERKGIRDSQGVLVLPVIVLRRLSITPDPSMQSLGSDTGVLQIAKQVSGKTNNLQNLELLKPASQRLKPTPVVHEITTVPFPNRVIINYEIVVQAQYTKQMNAITEKIFYSQGIMNSFVAPLENDYDVTGQGDSINRRKSLEKMFLVGFFEADHADTGNFDEFTDQERIVRYTTTIRIPATLQLDPEGVRPSITREWTSYGVNFGAEEAHFVDSQEEIEQIFGRN